MDNDENTQADESIPDKPEITSQISSESHSSSDFVAVEKTDLDADLKNVQLTNMASDVEDSTISYDNLPSIFDADASSSLAEHAYDTVITDELKDKSYQPMFGSLLFTESDPLNRAAFVVSTTSSIEVVRTPQEQTDTSIDEHDSSGNMQLALPLARAEDFDDDANEDDFDGIPVRHFSNTINKKQNGDSDSLLNHAEHNHFLNEFIHSMENDIEDETYLNGFSDEQHDTTAVVPSLFKNIPDIDDPNQPEEDDDDRNDDARAPFDQMDMFDQSDSICSSSPDSLLSSSHLQDEEEENVDVDDEVAQWNDDLILHTTSSNTNVQPPRINSPLILNINPLDQVDFIDSSRSQSQCSNMSSQLGFGYADQARTFMSDDELETSSASDDDDDEHNNADEHVMNFDCDTFERDDKEDICLEVNLDDHRSSSSTSKSNSIRSSSPIPDETPIIDMDEETNEEKPIQVAPIAALDDEEDVENDVYVPMTKFQNLAELQANHDRNDLIHEIVTMRHLLNENEQDDEFLAVMHNPTMFEEIIYDDNNQDGSNKKSDLIKQTNSARNSTFRPSLQLSIDNKIEEEKAADHLQTLHRRYLSLESNDGENPVSPSPSSQYLRKTTTQTPPVNNSSPTAVNHLATLGENEDDDDEDDYDGKEDARRDAKKDATSDTYQRKQKKQCLPYQEANTSDIDVKQFAYQEKYYPMLNMSMDSEQDDDDDDLELLQTLSQFHGIVNPPQTTRENHQSPLDSQHVQETQDLPDFPHRDRNEADFLTQTSSNSSQIRHSSPSVIDVLAKTDTEQEERAEKKNTIFYKNLYHNEGGNVASTSSFLLNDDSQSPVVLVDPDTSSSLPNLLSSSNEINHSPLFTTYAITDDSQMSSTNSNTNHLPKNDLLDETTNDLFDPFAPTVISPPITTTPSKTSGMLDDILFDSKEPDGLQSPYSPNQPFANYNFDDLWNQSMSHIASSNTNQTQSNIDFDPNTFSWNDLIKNTALTDPSTPKTNVLWDSIPNGETEENDLKQYLDWILSHLDSNEPQIEFTSIHNLESIIQDMRMCAVPFDPIPSPPLHVDHSVTNPMINATHHELFPINELEQPNINQGPSSMTLYEGDEREEITRPEESTLTPAVESLVSNTLQRALAEADEPNQHVEHLIDQILGQAIFEVHTEDTTPVDKTLPTENLATIISWHDQTKATNKQVPDPFDQKFDSVWSRHFEAPDDTTNENLFDNETEAEVDPWSATPTNKNEDPIVLFSKTIDETDLFSPTYNSIQNVQREIEDDDTSTFSDYNLPSILSSSAKVAAISNDLLKYTLTASVNDDSTDDNSTFDDSLPFRKNESTATANVTDVEVKEEPNDSEEITFRELNAQETLFDNNSRLSHFEAFASDRPLHSSDQDSKFANIISQFDDDFDRLTASQQQQQPVDDDAPWVSVDKPPEPVQSSTVEENEPWELEDHHNENLTPVPTTVRFSAFNDHESASTEKVNPNQNFFSDSFNPPTIKEEHANEETVVQPGPKTVHLDDQVQTKRSPTPSTDAFDETKISAKEDPDDIDIDDISPSFHNEPNYAFVSRTHATVGGENYDLDLSDRNLVFIFRIKPYHHRPTTKMHLQRRKLKYILQMTTFH
ncbi:unnamed protein product [Adineta ricciae]|uniref:Uncharacterized protein n=1 Tax=Adineta ricciae TaxID=249248 RepID=A0A814LMM5_ADIRI|nr:unnamed protein product [Adineta ricciae]